MNASTLIEAVVEMVQLPHVITACWPRTDSNVLYECWASCGSCIVLTSPELFVGGVVRNVVVNCKVAGARVKLYRRF